MNKILVLTVIALIILTVTAAAADFHAGGYDASCVLCLVNHLPLEGIVTPFYLPAECLVTWWAASEFPRTPIDQPYHIVPGRSPPPSC